MNWLKLEVKINIKNNTIEVSFNMIYTTQLFVKSLSNFRESNLSW